MNRLQGRWMLLGLIGVWILLSIAVYAAGYSVVSRNEPELRQQFWNGECNPLQEVRLRNLGETPIDYSVLETTENSQEQIKTVLKYLESWGCLPFGHYFILGIDTSHTDLVLSQKLKETYPDDIWIYLEHRFRKVSVEDNNLAVTVFFDDRPQRLVIPIDSILYFGDPNYGFLIDLRVPDGANYDP